MKSFDWFIGMYEGEGCYTWGNKVQLVMTSTDADVILWCRDIMSRYSRNQNGVKVMDKGIPKTGKKRVYRVILTGKGAKRLAADLYPHLSQRRQEQIDRLNAR